MTQPPLVSWNTLDPAIRRIAETHLPPKQLDAYRLWEDGLGYGRIALRLHISSSSARDRVHRAIRTIELHLEQGDVAA